MRLLPGYMIYHPANAYLGTVLLCRALAGLPEVELFRRPGFRTSRQERVDWMPKA